MCRAGCPRSGTVQIWDPVSASQLAKLSGHTGWVSGVVGFVRPDGNTLLATTGGGDRTVRIWDLATATQMATLTGHTSWVNAVAGTTGPAGNTLLATGSGDRTVRIWDPTADFRCLVLSLGIAADVVSVGRELALATAEGVILVCLEPAAWETGRQGHGVWIARSVERAWLNTVLRQRIRSMWRRGVRPR
ncbi:hypothetical protein ACFWA5_49435 [Streptomyces mirabilis]|uniref:hypothetical protein n=1 Tax=Streptomyces mirabilis TaxID=68239 RepID=UPI003652817A